MSHFTEPGALPFVFSSPSDVAPAAASTVPSDAGADDHFQPPGALHAKHRCLSNLVDIKSCSVDHQLTVAVFNAQSVGNKLKRIDIVEFIQDEHVDMMFLTETWLKTHGDESKHADLTPAGYCLKSHPRMTRAGGVAVLVRDHFQVVLNTSFPFPHDSFEVIQVTLTAPVCVHFFCIYRPPPSKSNKLTDVMFYSEFHDLLEFVNTLQGKSVLLGDFNFHYDDQLRYSTVRMMDILSTFGLEQSVKEPTHRSGHIID